MWIIYAATAALAIIVVGNFVNGFYKEYRGTPVLQGSSRRRSTGVPFLRDDGRFSTDVVGESRYQSNLDEVAGPRTHDGVEKLLPAELVFEGVTHPTDPQAVAVLIGGKPVGFLDRDESRDLRLYLHQELGSCPPRANCQALVRGGWDRGPDDRGMYGVRLDLPI